jgi:hypothetical protein
MCGEGVQATIPGGVVDTPGLRSGSTVDTPVTEGHLHCSTHPGARAAWACDGCRRQLCPECAEALEAGRGVTVVACRECGGSTQPLTVPGSDQSFPSSVRHLLAVPVGAGGVAVLLALAVVAGWLAHDGAGARWFLVPWSVPAACLAVAIVRAQAEALGVGLQFRGRRLAWPGAVPRRSRQLVPGNPPST